MKRAFSFTLGQRLSDPLWHAGRMKSDEAIEPVDEDVAALKCALTEWESITAQLLEQLHSDVRSDRAANWRPHVDQIVRAIVRYRALCREELGKVGGWREDGLDPLDVHQLVWEQGDRLAKWLARMVAP